MQASESFTLTALSIDPQLIKRLDEAGIDRIGIDIERNGKRERQASISGSRISNHEIDHLKLLKNIVKKADIFIRINPLHSGSLNEINQSLSLGADVIMIPYFTSASEVSNFVQLVAGRAKIVLLLETAQAMLQLPVIVAIPGLSEIMVGLNDLHLSLGLKNPFEVITAGYLQNIAKQVLEAGLSFGFGGLARVDDVTLPIPSDFIYSQYSRLGANSAWLSRSFFKGLERELPRNIALEVANLRGRLNFWSKQSEEVIETKHAELCQHMRHLTHKEKTL